MMNYRQLYLGFAALLAASCTQEIELEETVARSPYEKVQITAGTPMTRMTAEKDGQLTHFNWNRGDMIALATSEQQLPYITHNDGSTATFLSALGSSASKDDYLYDKEGSVVYARYPYKDTQPVDMETLTTPVSLGTPLLYAVDTLQDGKLDLHFHHAMAYLRFHVQHDILRTEDSISTWFEMSFDYERDRFPISGQFDYKTKSIQPTDSTWRWQLPLSLLSDTVSLYPIFPFKSNRKFVFELGQEDVSMPETNTDAYYYSKSVLKDLPSGGLQAGHVYDVYLDYRDGSNFLRQLYESTNGWNWKNNTNWLRDNPYNEWYGITTDSDGNILGINLSDNNLEATSLSLSIPKTIKSFVIDNNNINRLQLTSSGGMLSVSLDNCVRERVIADGIYRLALSHSDSISIAHEDCKQLEISDCHFKSEDSPFNYYDWNTSCEKVCFKNCSMYKCEIESDTLVFENSTTSYDWCAKTTQLLAIVNSTCTGINRSFNDDTEIRLENATLINPNGQNITISNVTATLTGAKWGDFINSYKNDPEVVDFLRQLYETTNGDNWANNYNWLSQQPLNLWYGVSVDEESNITDIVLENNNLTGTDVSLQFPSRTIDLSITESESLIDNLYLDGSAGEQIVHLDNSVKNRVEARCVDDLYVYNCDTVFVSDGSCSLSVENVKQIHVSDCNNLQIFPWGGGSLIDLNIINCISYSDEYTGLAVSHDYPQFQNVTMEQCTVDLFSNMETLVFGTYNMTMVDSNVRFGNRAVICTQLNIKGSTCTGLSRNNFELYYEPNTLIILENATLVNPNGMDLTINNVTRTLTAAEWDAFIQSYLGDETDDSHGGSNPGGGASPGE